jgi:hypothetical protein
VSHASAVGTENKISRAAVLALAAGNGCGAQTRYSLSHCGIDDVPAHLNHRAGKLMSQDHRGIITKRIVKNMDIRSTDSTVGNLKLYLVLSATRLLNFPYIDVSFPTRILNQSFHRQFLKPLLLKVCDLAPPSIFLAFNS